MRFQSAVLVDGRSVTRGKPDPEGYLLAARLLGVLPGDCLVVEDAPAGVDAARAAGMRAADVVVASLAEAQPLLLSWVAAAAGD